MCINIYNCIFFNLIFQIFKKFKIIDKCFIYYLFILYNELIKLFDLFLNKNSMYIYEISLIIYINSKIFILLKFHKCYNLNLNLL